MTRLNPLAVAALFIALGGSSYAAAGLGRGSVTSQAIARDAVTSSKVKDGSLLARDVKLGKLPAASRLAGQDGAAGEAGPVGPKGEPGAQGDRGDKGAPGLAEARSIVHDGNPVGIGSTPTTIASLDVEAGTYLVEAKAVVFTPGKNDAMVVCTLKAGSAKDGALTTVVPPASETLATHLLTTLPAAGQIVLSCEKNAFNVAIGATDIRLTAVRLGEGTSTTF